MRMIPSTSGMRQSLVLILLLRILLPVHGGEGAASTWNLSSSSKKAGGFVDLPLSCSLQMEEEAVVLLGRNPTTGFYFPVDQQRMDQTVNNATLSDNNDDLHVRALWDVRNVELKERWSIHRPLSFLRARGGSDVSMRKERIVGKAISASRRLDGQGSSEDSSEVPVHRENVRVRPCHCLDDATSDDTDDQEMVPIDIHYCPLLSNVCRRAEGNEDNILCLYVDAKKHVKRSEIFVDVAFGWLVFVIMWLFCSGHGRNCMNYIIGTLCCINSWKFHVANRLMERDPVRSHILIISQMLRTSEDTDVQSTESPTTTPSSNEINSSSMTVPYRGVDKRHAQGTLMLRTKIYDGAHSGMCSEVSACRGKIESSESCTSTIIDRRDSNDSKISSIDKDHHVQESMGDVDKFDNATGVTCSICLVDLEVGDRLGHLECSHLFHVTCLKDWLKRRNVCPLCQASNVALVCQAGDQQLDPSEGEDQGQEQ